MGTTGNTYYRVAGASLQHPWSFGTPDPRIRPPMLAVVAGVIARRLAGVQRAEALAYVPRDVATPATTPGIAVLPLHGVIAPRMNLFSDISGGTTLEELTPALREAVRDERVGSIILDINSPGGSVAGVTEFAQDVLAARLVKPVYAQAHFEACSAAYWIAACATRVIASPSSLVGSIGVYTMHEDLSKALDELGIKITYISAGAFKVDGNETEPLSETARARLTAIVEASYTQFVTDVATGRGVPVDQVRRGFGQGAVVTAEEALTLGLVDEIATLDQTIAHLQTPSLTARARALDQVERTRAAFELHLM